MENMCSPLDSLQRPGGGVHRVFVDVSVLTKREWVEGGGCSLCGMGCAFLGQMSAGVEKTRAAVPLECSLARLLGEPLSEKWLASFVNGVRERVSAHEVLVFDRDEQMLFVSSGLMRRGLFRSLLLRWGL